MSHIFSDRISLTFQVFQVLKDQITRGDFGPSNRLPTELEIAKNFGVSVVTVQRALRDLSAAGLITRHRRRGTFVSDSRAAQVHPQQADALSLMFSDEFDTDTDVPEKKVSPRPEYLRRVFPDHEQLLHIRRIVFRDGKPWSHANIFLLPEYADRVTRPMIKRYPMFRLLREKLGLSFNNVKISLQSRSADVENAQALQIDALTPVMVMNATLFDTQDRALNWLEINYRGDSFIFRFEMDLEGTGKG